MALRAIPVPSCLLMLGTKQQSKMPFLPLCQLTWGKKLRSTVSSDFVILDFVVTDLMIISLILVPTQRTSMIYIYM